MLHDVVAETNGLDKGRQDLGLHDKLGARGRGSGRGRGDAERSEELGHLGSSRGVDLHLSPPPCFVAGIG